MSSHSVRYRFLILFLVLLLSSVPFSSFAEVHIGQDKPADWYERNLMTVIVAETAYNDVIIIQQG